MTSSFGLKNLNISGQEIFENGKKHFSSHTGYLFVLRLRKERCNCCHSTTLILLVPLRCQCEPHQRHIVFYVTGALDGTPKHSITGQA